MTAVEWLEEQYQKQITFLHREDFEKAKEIEKQQLIDCGNSCAFNQVIHNRKLDLMNLQQLEEFVEEEYLTFGEEYYNKEFKK